MSRHSWLGQEFSIATECFCRDRVWPNGEVLCYDIAILCRDIVGQVGKIFCLDRGFLGRDRVAKARGNYVVTKQVYVTT